MQGSVTLNELGVFIVFALIVVVSGYTILVLRNITGLIKEVSVMLQKNKEDLNRIIPSMAVATENTAKISEEFGFKQDGKYIEKIMKEKNSKKQ